MVRTNTGCEGGGACDLSLEGWWVLTFTNEERILSGCRKSRMQDTIGGALDRLISLAHLRGVELEQGCQVLMEIAYGSLLKPRSRFYDTGLFEYLGISQEADCCSFLFFLFLIAGYFIRLPRGFRLTQDSLKIVGSSDYPGINK